jgi:hypothetical protein
MNRLALRNIFLLLILLFLLAAVIALRNRSPFGKNQSSFASEPVKEITRIEFSEGKNRLFLNLEGENWRVNGKHEARKSGVMFIIRILTEMQIKSPISPDIFKKEITEKGVVPVKVKVYENRKLLKSFLVYKTASNKYGNVMKMRDKAKPFIVSAPGFEGDIGSAFTLNELFWQPYTVFNLLPSEMASVTLENFSEPESSFTINIHSGTFTLTDTKHLLTGWDTTRVQRYISYFTWVPFESWALDLDGSQQEKIKKETPLFRITVSKADGSNRNITIWDKYSEKTGERDSDRAWAKTSDRDQLFIVRYFDIDPLLKKRSYFFTEK